MAQFAAVSDETNFISSLVNTRSNPLDYGVTPEMMDTFSPELEFIISYSKLHGTDVPPVDVMLSRFEDYRHTETEEVGYYADEVINAHNKRILVSKIHEASKFVKDDEIEKAMYAISSFVPPTRNKPQDNALEDEDFLTKYEDKEDSLVVPWQTLQERTGGIRRGDLWYLAARLSQGKALAHGTKVSTPEGFMNIEDISVGDYVTGSNGKKTKVIAVHPQGEKEVVKVEFTDQTVVEVCEDHLWTVRIGTKHWKVVTTKHLIDHEGQNYMIPSLSEPVQYKESKVTFDPYKLGLLLGDGCFRGDSPSFTNSEEEIVEAIGNGMLTPWGSSGIQYGVKNLKKFLEKNGLWGKKSCEKFIPEEFLYSSPDKRLALLQGLMDTDGGATGTGGAEFSSTSYELARGVQHLAESLGGYSHFHKRQTYFQGGKPGLPSYRLIVVLPKGMNPFRLSRKADAYTRDGNRIGRSVVSAVRTGEYKQMTCITVESPDSLFAMEHCLLTHNSWSLLSFARTALLAGHNVKFYSLEMSRYQVMVRMHVMLGAALGLHVDHVEMRDRTFNKEDYQLLVKRVKEEIPGKFFVHDSSMGRVTPQSIIHDQGQTDLVIIDYAGLMSTATGGRAIDDWRSMGLISNMLKESAVASNLRILAAAQINREGDTMGSAPPKVKNLAQSDALGQDADVVLTHKQMSKSAMVYGIEKNRHGAAGDRFYTRFLPNTGRFKEISKDTAEEIKDEEDCDY